jgi:hypothetical protein
VYEIRLSDFGDSLSVVVRNINLLRDQSNAGLGAIRDVARSFTERYHGLESKPEDPKEVAEAEAAAEELLADLIGEDAYRIWTETHTIYVPSSIRPHQRYVIRPGHRIDIERLSDRRIPIALRETNKWVADNRSICIETHDEYPIGDQMASIYLLCKYDESSLWTIGNVYNFPVLPTPFIRAMAWD